MKLRVFNIQYYSLHDGPGIRTVVFLKGCPLRCRWCCNPESQRPDPELFFSRKKCLGFGVCGLCAAACPAAAIGPPEYDEPALKTNRAVRIDLSRCAPCAASFPCVASCPAKALELKGREMDIETILDAVEREELFYHHGGGGLTVSGGEPLMQGEGLIRLLHGAKRRRLNTAMETCGFGDYGVLREAARYLDALFFDLKSLDDKKHRQWTGVSNEPILNNFDALRADFPNLPLTVRTPVIPGFNDGPEELDRIRNAVGASHELLPYHRWGEWKYEALGRAIP